MSHEPQAISQADAIRFTHCVCCECNICNETSRRLVAWRHRAALAIFSPLCCSLGSRNICCFASLIVWLCCVFVPIFSRLLALLRPVNYFLKLLSRHHCRFLLWDGAQKNKHTRTNRTNNERNMVQQIHALELISKKFGNESRMLNARKKSRHTPKKNHNSNSKLYRSTQSREKSFPSWQIVVSVHKRW